MASSSPGRGQQERKLLVGARRRALPAALAGSRPLVFEPLEKRQLLSNSTTVPGDQDDLLPEPERGDRDDRPDCGGLHNLEHCGAVDDVFRVDDLSGLMGPHRLPKAPKHAEFFPLGGAQVDTRRDTQRALSVDLPIGLSSGPGIIRPADDRSDRQLPAEAELADIRAALSDFLLYDGEVYFGVCQGLRGSEHWRLDESTASLANSITIVWAAGD